MKTQMPSVVFRAYVLEQEGAPYLLSTHLTEQGAADRLAAEQRKFDPRCADLPCWLYVLTVRDGEVIARRDLSPNLTETRSFATA